MVRLSRDRLVSHGRKGLHGTLKDRESTNKGAKKKICILCTFLCFVLALYLSFDYGDGEAGQSLLTATTTKATSLFGYDVSEECKRLPFIRPMGSYFLDGSIGFADSAEGVEPAFKIGSNFGKQATKHMEGDRPNFQLVKEILDKKGDGLVLDIGANQGFYTWYLATLGMNVLAFEILEKNVKALQHGAEVNPPEVAKKVFIFPVGLGEKTGRMSMDGTNYEGFLSSQGSGPILTTSYDCFAHHNGLALGDALVSNVAFIKLDVEGFEIAVLRGAKKSLFGPKGKVGALLVEVGPGRWSRAKVEFDTGVAEMIDLSTHFKNSYLIVRTGGSFVKTCPPTLAGKLADQNPRVMEGVKVHKMKASEVGAILKELKDMEGDCNFWYTN